LEDYKKYKIEEEGDLQDYGDEDAEEDAEEAEEEEEDAEEILKRLGPVKAGSRMSN